MLCPLVALFAGESAAAKKPNIIFIYADDLGWGDLAAHGHPVIKTPVLDQMIKEGTDYTQFNVASAVCSPSRAAVMTGKFPSFFSIHQHFAVSSQNRKLGMPDWLDPHITLLPRLLHEAGYATAHFGKWHLSNSYYQSPSPLQYGYDRAAVWCGEKPDVFTDVPMTNDPLGKIDKKAPEFLTVASVNHSEKFIRDFAGKKTVLPQPLDS
jgi:N-acetylgalactosamine-6-sulfatase